MEKEEFEVQLARIRADYDLKLQEYKTNCELHVEEYKQSCERQTEHYKVSGAAIASTNSEMFKAVIAFALAGLRGVFVLNGAAAVALLSKSGAQGFEFSLFAFAVGAALAVLASGVAFGAQVEFQQHYGETAWDVAMGKKEYKETDKGKKIRKVAAALWLLSLFAFAFGCIQALPILAGSNTAASVSFGFPGIG